MQQEHTAAVKMSQTLFDLIYPKLIPRRGFVADLDVKEKKKSNRHHLKWKGDEI